MNLSFKEQIVNNFVGTWMSGPTLPANIWKSSLLIHPKGGVILVAGAKNGEYSVSNTIYRLRNLGNFAIITFLQLTLIEFEI